jgi:hypothetical protein
MVQSGDRLANITKNLEDLVFGETRFESERKIRIFSDTVLCMYVSFIPRPARLLQIHNGLMVRGLLSRPSLSVKAAAPQEKEGKKPLPLVHHLQNRRLVVGHEQQDLVDAAVEQAHARVHVPDQVGVAVQVRLRAKMECLEFNKCFFPKIPGSNPARM